MSDPTCRAGVQAIIDGAEAGGAVIGVAAAWPDGARFEHRGARRFVAASTVKIAIMIELFRQVDAGRLSLATALTLGPADKATGSGVVAALHDGIELTLGDHAYLMMSISDNSSTNILIDQVGQAAVNRTMGELGMAGSTLGRRMRGVPAAAEEAENWAVPNDYVRALAALFDGRAASPAACERMLALLEAQQNERRIARFLPAVDRPRWGSKTGSLAGVTNDVGWVVTSGGPVLMAVFTEGLADPHEGERVIGEIARALLAGG